MPQPLHERLGQALDGDGAALQGLAGARAVDRRDEALTLLLVHDLHLGPLDRVGERARWQHHPAVAAVKQRLEDRYLARLEVPPEPVDDAVAAVRRLAAGDQVPAVYTWLADEADREAATAFLAVEGGPDGGFDDLVAVCQVGLAGEPKLEMARNYWDEMGRGVAAGVHTELHRRYTAGAGVAVPPPVDQPVPALERRLLGSVLATNRRLQPEMVGALGLVELQAGPRCRHVAAGLRRLGFPEETVAFYAEHAVADPRHGKDWLDHVVALLAADPRWTAGIVRGARWRAEVDRRFLADAAERFLPAATRRRTAA
jgi:Iron-containing redox enzyme